VFALGTQHWRVKKITHNDVLVTEAAADVSAPPFWKSESVNRDFHYSERIGEFLEASNDEVNNPEYLQRLITHNRLDELAATQLAEYLYRQKQHCNADLPHRHHLLIEQVNAAPGGAAGHQIVIHSIWGARVNRPWALAMEAAWEQKFGKCPEIYVSNDCLVLQLPPHIEPELLLTMVPPENIEMLLRRRLEGSGFFGARFRENAGRALLLSKGKFSERKPLWMSRLQSQQLLETVQRFDDFPILLETWRTCLQDEFDLPHLKQLLTELHHGDISVSFVQSQYPSPMAQAVGWDQINSYMYMDDKPKSGAQTGLSDELLKEVLHTPALRPAVPVSVIKSFIEKSQRLIPGYHPETETEWIDWVVERSLLPESEWQLMSELTSLNTDRLVYLRTDNQTVVVARDIANGITQGFYPGQHVELRTFAGTTLTLTTHNEDSETDDDSLLETYLSNWLQFYGPQTFEKIADKTGIDHDRLLATLNSLTNSQFLVSGELVLYDPHHHWCDSRNFEILMRLNRRGLSPVFSALPSSHMQSFLYHWQTRHPGTPDTPDHTHLYPVLESLSAYVAPSQAWEADILPARISDYRPAQLDQIFQEGEVSWIGMGSQQHCILFKQDMDMLFDKQPVTDPAISSLLPLNQRKDFNQLLDDSGDPAADIADKLWQASWSSTVTNDTYMALRKGIENGFKVPSPGELTGSRRRTIRRSGFSAWRGSVPITGTWQQLDWPEPEDDLLERENRSRDRVHLLFNRYGILFRELLQRESAPFRWRNLFRSLRLMELSGEALGGHFFQDVPGLQFILPDAFRHLQRQQQDKIFWLNAADPISLSGLGINAITSRLPRRIAGNYVVYHGSELVLTVQRQGRQLDFEIPPEHPDLIDYLGVLTHLLQRQVNPIRRLQLEIINDEPALKSPYLDIITNTFEVIRDHRYAYLHRQNF